MTRFAKAIAPFVNREIASADRCRHNGDVHAEFSHLENAHVLGQESTYQHVRAHWRMLKWGLRQNDVKEVVGQVVRIVGAFTKTAVKLLPEGNTGGSNISPFKKLPIKPEFLEIINQAKLKA